MSIQQVPAQASPAENRPEISTFPGPSIRSRTLRTTLQCTIRPVLQLWGHTPNLPWPYELFDQAARLLPPVDGTEYRPVRLPNCGAEWLRGPGASSDRVILYLHGGAFICCGLRTHRRLLSRISVACDAPALSVDYRMLPGQPVSASIDDCVDGYRRLLAQGYRPEQIVVAGDSAGGYMALMTAFEASDRGLGRPGAVVCQSPFVDTDPGRKLEKLGDMRDPLFPANALVSLTHLMTRVEESMGHPAADGRVRSPLDVDLSQLPPVLIQAGADELLSVDAELAAAHIAAVGVECHLEWFEGQFHVFQAAADLIPEGQIAIDRIGEFVRSHVAG